MLGISSYVVSANNQFINGPSLNNFGEVGLLQIPNARFIEPGRLAFGISHTELHNHYFFALQSLPWLASTLSYTRINQDASWDTRLDTKIRLHQESTYWPQIALGIRSLAGTDQLASEYLVASKRYYNWDFTVGIGWGNLAADHTFKNPLRILGSHFNQRNYHSNGIIRTNSWFRGTHSALFAGASYQTQIPGLLLKLELAPHNPQKETSNTSPKTPLNIGVTYRPRPGLDLSLGLESGDTLMAQAVLHTQLNKADQSKKLLQYQPTKNSSTNPLRSIVFDLTKQGYQINTAHLNQNTLTIESTPPNGLYTTPQALGRIGRIADRYLSEKTIPHLHYIEQKKGLPTASILLPRWDYTQAIAHQGSPEEVWRHTKILPPPITSTAAIPRLNYCTGNFTPELRQHLTAQQNYYYQLRANLAGECQLNNHWSLAGSLSLDIANNINQLTLPQPSPLATVRRDIQRYIQQRKQGIENLELNYHWKPKPNWYARVSGGLLEEMYAGFSTELLYQPYDTPWAFGFDLSHVRKRAFNKLLNLQGSATITGHLTSYYHLAKHNIDIKFSAGRYLAKDSGATLELAHHFTNGTKIGAYTSFSKKSGNNYQDKGIYLLLPINQLFANRIIPYFNFNWRSLTRDNGQKIQNNNQLYTLTRNTTKNAINKTWHTLLD